MTPDVNPHRALPSAGTCVDMHTAVLRGLFTWRQECGGDPSELLSLSSEHGVRKPTGERGRGASLDLGKYVRVAPGDLVVNRLVARDGALAVSTLAGIVSPAYWVLRPRAALLDSRFCHHLMRSRPVIDRIARVSKFQPPAQYDVLWSDFRAISVSLPSIEDQRLLSRFLDYADRRIRRYIRVKQNLVKLVEEQKQAIIHRAVTCGLDPNVRLKNSGVEWLGDVPEHWEVKPLKHFVPQVTVGIVIQPARLYVNAGVPCLRSLNISSGVIKADDVVFISPKSNAEHRKSQIFAGDLVVVRTGQAGVAAIVTPEFDGANCIDLLIVRQSPRLVSEYLLTYLNSWPARTDVQYRSVGAIQAHYNTATLGNLAVAAPPLAEQREILDNVAEQLSPLDESIRMAHSEIALFEEYRTRLTADVITGRLDVREAASRLPDDAEEANLDEGEVVSDAEEDTPNDLDAVAEDAEA